MRVIPKSWILVLTSVVAGILIWRCQSSDPPLQLQGANSNTPDEAQTAETRPLGKDRSTTTASVPRPDLSPVIDGPVSLRREPRQPKESDFQYESRSRFVVAFDWFRQESKISEDKEQQILAILGEAQRKLVIIEAHQMPALLEGGERLELYMKWAPIYSTDIALAAEREISELLGPDEFPSWARYMRYQVTPTSLQYGRPIKIEPRDPVIITPPVVPGLGPLSPEQAEELGLTVEF